MANYTDYGLVRHITVQHQHEGETVSVALEGKTEGGEAVSLHLTRGAARSLWSHITQILYPRAADQLTQRITTAATRPEGSSEMTHMVQVEESQDDPNIIQIGGISRHETWVMRIDHDSGHDLWVRLEDIFDHV